MPRSSPIPTPSTAVPALAVIAGGRGSRMGAPKYDLSLAGEPILTDLLRRLDWPGPTILALGFIPAIPTSATPPPCPNGSAAFSRVVHDPVPDEGPLRGLLTALDAAPGGTLLALPVDMPALAREHLDWLLAQAAARPAARGILLRSAAGELEPFPCVIRRSLAPDIRAALAAGRRSLHQLADLPGVDTISAPSTWPAAVWTNLNTPQDLAGHLANHLAAQPLRPPTPASLPPRPPTWTEPTPTTVPITRWDARSCPPLAAATDELAPEDPLEIRVRGHPLAITMRTPGHDDELAAGFLLTEGVIRRAADIELIEPCGENDAGNILNVRLAPLIHLDLDRLTRHVFTASSCGLCGKATIESVRRDHPPVQSDLRVRAETLAALPAAMRHAQPTFDRTGGLHAAALFDESGALLVAREDVGRHNAVDKALGRALLDSRPLDRAILLVSGRSSFEIMQKAAAARVPIVAAVSAPSSLAVAFAQEMGQTLVGFLRDGRMNVYTHGDRVIFPTSSVG